MTGGKVHRAGVAYTAREANARHKRDCVSAPATPASPVLDFLRHRTHHHTSWTAKARWAPVTLDVAGRPLTVEGYQVELTACDASGEAVELNLQTKRAATDGADFVEYVNTAPVVGRERSIGGAAAGIRKTLTGLTAGIGARVEFLARKSTTGTTVACKFSVWDVTAGAVVISKNGPATSTRHAQLIATLGFTPIAAHTYEARVDWQSGTVGAMLFSQARWFDVGAAAVWRQFVQDDAGDHALFRDIPNPRSWYYSFRVRALNRLHGGRCWSAWTSWSTAVIPTDQDQITGPPVPTGLVMQLHKDAPAGSPWRARCIWNETPHWVEPDGDARLGASRYHVKFQVAASNGGTVMHVRHTTVLATEDGTTAETSFGAIRGKRWYRFAVAAVDQDGNPGAWSAFTSWASPRGDPDPPTGVVTKNPLPRVIRVLWTPPADLTDVDRFKVRVYRNSFAGTLVETLYAGRGADHCVWHVDAAEYAAHPHATYVARVNSIEDPYSTEIDDGAPGSTAEVLSTNLDSGTVADTVTLDTGSLAASDGLAPSTSPAATATVPGGAPGTIVVTWTPISNADTVSYEVWRGTTSGFVPPGAGSKIGVVVGTASTTFTDSTPAVGTAYWYRIIARDPDGAAAPGTVSSSATAHAQGTDGSPPASSPTPTVNGGPTYLAIKWAPVANADPVSYDVHLSTTTGFTPSGTTPGSGTCVAVTELGSIIVNTTVAGGALAYATTYYVKLVERDADGAAAAGAQGSASLVQIVTGDISTDAITAALIAAGAITSSELAAGAVIAGKIAALTIVAGDIAANTITGGKLVAGTISATELGADSVTAVKILAGSVTSAKLEATLIIGTTIETAAVGSARVTLDSTGFYSFGVPDADGTDNLNASILTADGSASFGSLSVGRLTSDNVVTFGVDTVQRFIDATYGDDAHDGLLPDAVTTSAPTATGNWDAYAMDAHHTWHQLLGLAASLQTVSATDYRAVLQATATQSYISSQSGGMFEELFFKFQADKIPTGAVVSCDAMFRARDNGAWSTNANAYLVRCTIPLAAGIPKVALFSGVDGTYTSLVGDTNSADAGAIAANADWSVRAQCYYNYATQATTLRAKFWKSSGTEPTTWTVTAATADAELQRAGAWGFRFAPSASLSNAPVTIKLTGIAYNLLDPDLIAADDSPAAIADTTLFYAPTSTGPFATLSRALRDVENYNQGAAFLVWHNGTDLPLETATHIDGFVGGGSLVITGSSPTITGSFTLSGNSTWIRITGLTFTDPGGGDSMQNGYSGTVFVSASRYVELSANRIHSNSNAVANVLAGQGSVVRVERCQMNGGVTEAILATHGAYVQAVGNTGAGVTYSYFASGSLILISGSAPTGGNGANEGGKVFATAVADAPASTAVGTAPPTSTKVTKTWVSVAGSTYGLTYNTWSGGESTQGAYGGSQNHKGMWRFGNGLQNALAGKTIDGAWIYLTRKNYGGQSGQVNVYLFSANTATFGGEPGVTSGPTLLGSLAYGQGKWFRIPSGVANDLKTAVGGATRLLGVFQSGGSPYIILSPNAKVKVTYH